MARLKFKRRARKDAFQRSYAVKCGNRACVSERVLKMLACRGLRVGRELGPSTIETIGVDLVALFY